VSKADTARIIDEVAKLDEGDRKKVLKGIKKLVRGEAGPSGGPAGEATSK
jgi:hypothetical protein